MTSGGPCHHGMACPQIVDGGTASNMLGKKVKVSRDRLKWPGRLRPWIILTFGNTRVVGCQPYAPAAFTPGKFPGTHFQRLSQHQGTWLCRKEPQKKIPSDGESIPGPSD
jgi:hypothetical protein